MIVERLAVIVDSLAVGDGVTVIDGMEGGVGDNVTVGDGMRAGDGVEVGDGATVAEAEALGGPVLSSSQAAAANNINANANLVSGLLTIRVLWVTKEEFQSICDLMCPKAGGWRGIEPFDVFVC